MEQKKYIAVYLVAAVILAVAVPAAIKKTAKETAAKHLQGPEYQYFQEVSGYDKNFVRLPRQYLKESPKSQ